MSVVNAGKSVGLVAIQPGGGGGGGSGGGLTGSQAAATTATTATQKSDQVTSSKSWTALWLR
jgi:hypothetical protein